MPPGPGPVDDGRNNGAGLGQESDVSRERTHMGKAGIETNRRHQSPDAIGPQQAHQMRARCLEQ
jgi:hypothetical protein